MMAFAKQTRRWRRGRLRHLRLQWQVVGQPTHRQRSMAAGKRGLNQKGMHRMNKRPVIGVTVDRCDLCDGFWADHGQISAISDSLVARAHGPVPAHQIAETRLGLAKGSGILTDGHLERGHIYQAFAAWLTHRGTS